MNKFKKISIIFLILVWNSPINLWAATKHDLNQSARHFLALHAHEEALSAIAISASFADQMVNGYATTTVKPEPITQNSLFQIGSLTKSFIAAIILQIEEDPRYQFSINQSINDFFPQYPNWHAITVKNLLNMTSGIPDFLSDKNFMSSFSANPYQPQNIDHWLNIIYQKPLSFLPGTQYAYSNTNYFLLGKIIEEITGHSLHHEIVARLIKPLHLKHTDYFDNVISRHTKQQLIHGFQIQKAYADFIPLGTDVTHFNLSYAGPAAGIVSNTHDMTIWIKSLFTPGKVLSKKQLEKMTTVISEKTGHAISYLSPEDPEGYGLGIRILYHPMSKNLNVYAYEGMTFGYRAIYLYSPLDEVMVVATANSNFDAKENHLYQLINQVFTNIIAANRVKKIA